jgi:hypothetical protein
MRITGNENKIQISNNINTQEIYVEEIDGNINIKIIKGDSPITWDTGYSISLHD